MKRIGRTTLGIAQGSELLFSDFADGGPMWTGEGSRESRHQIRFAETYAAPPTVMVGISMWDLDRETNSRANIAAEAVTVTGFDLVFRTWGDTRVARIRADWTAFGPLRDEDDWDIA